MERRTSYGTPTTGPGEYRKSMQVHVGMGEEDEVPRYNNYPNQRGSRQRGMEREREYAY